MGTHGYTCEYPLPHGFLTRGSGWSMGKNRHRSGCDIWHPNTCGYGSRSPTSALMPSPSGLLASWFAISGSDCHGFWNPCGLWVGYARVQVQVGFIWPSPYPYPWCGLWVTHQVGGGFLWQSLNRDQLFGHCWSRFPPLPQHPSSLNKHGRACLKVSHMFLTLLPYLL